MSVADFAQSGSLSINGFCAASDSASTVDFFFSHSSEFEDTATTRLPSFEATANITVFGFGFNDSSSALHPFIRLALGVETVQIHQTDGDAGLLFRLVDGVRDLRDIRTEQILRVGDVVRGCNAQSGTVIRMDRRSYPQHQTQTQHARQQHANRDIPTFCRSAAVSRHADGTQMHMFSDHSSVFSLHTLTDDIASTVPSGCANRDRMEKHTNHH